MTEYLDGALSPTEQRRFETHLRDCVACAVYLSQMRASVELLGFLDPDDLPSEVLDELVDLYRRVRVS